MPPKKAKVVPRKSLGISRSLDPSFGPIHPISPTQSRDRSRSPVSPGPIVRSQRDSPVPGSSRDHQCCQDMMIDCQESKFTCYKSKEQNSLTLFFPWIIGLINLGKDVAALMVQVAKGPSLPLTSSLVTPISPESIVALEEAIETDPLWVSLVSEKKTTTRTIY